MQLILACKEHCKITRVSNFTNQAIDIELALTVSIRKTVKFFCLLKKVLLFSFGGTGSYTIAQPVLGPTMEHQSSGNSTVGMTNAHPPPHLALNGFLKQESLYFIYFTI